MSKRAVIIVLAALTVPLWAGQASTDRGAWMYAPCDRNSDDPAQCIESLLKPYPGDGALWFEYGTQLSKALVAHTSVFFDVAEMHPKQFSEWLRDLDGNTFNILEDSDSVEADLQRAYLNRLRDLMLRALTDYAKLNQHTPMVVRTLEGLKKIKVGSPHVQEPKD